MWLKIKISQWNKNGVYIMRRKKKKKPTWLQACFLEDVRVIWCNSLANSHFQTYMMNNVEIVIDCYLHITSHVSHAVTSCTHYTSYYSLNLVHDIVCEFGLAIQDYMFFDVDTKYVHWLIFGDKMCYTLFWKIWVEFKCFWKSFKLILMHFIHEISWSECFLHKTPVVFQKFNFSRFSIDRVFSSTNRKCLNF